MEPGNHCVCSIVKICPSFPDDLRQLFNGRSLFVLSGCADIGDDTLLADHTNGERNGSQATDQGEGQASSFLLIIIEPAGKQKTDSHAQRNPGPCDEYDFC